MCAPYRPPYKPLCTWDSTGARLRGHLTYGLGFVCGSDGCLLFFGFFFLTSNTLRVLDKPRPPPVLEMLGTWVPRGDHVTPASSVVSPGNGPGEGHRSLQHEHDLPTGGAQGAPDLL